MSIPKTSVYDSLPVFQNNIMWISMVAQIIGLFPLTGIWSKEVRDLKFKWFAKRVGYSLIITTGSIFNALMSLFRMCYSGYDLHRLSTFIFNANSAVGGVVFFNLAKKWPKLIRNWGHIESSLDNRNATQHVKRNYNMIIIIVMTAALVEHLLSLFHVATLIPSDNPDKVGTYLSASYPHLFEFFEFSTPLAIFAVVMNILNVFSWNFLDAFLMVISSGLANHFEQVTARIVTACNTKVSIKYHWMKIREDYNKICILCKKVNKEISTLIIVSFATNMFFITAQLHGSLSQKSTTLGSIYFLFSFGLLVLRTIAVILFGSRVNDESKKSLSYLLSLKSYNLEIERLTYQIYCQPVALTGNEFFTITKGLLLGMTGSIVTYELFLIQSSGASVD